jgi:hypothetical protein
MAILDATGTTLEIGTGSTGSAKTITDVSLTNPMILTSTGHGLVNGDLVTASLFAGADAASINGKKFVVKYATANTFAIDLDASALTITDNEDGAKMTPAAFVKVGTITNFSMNPTASERDRTTLKDTERVWKRGIRDGGSMTFNVLWDNEDTGLDAVKTAYEDDSENLAFRITFSDNEAITLQNGYVLDYSISGEVDADATGAITIRGTVAS